jgi:heat-inducible transcriptional repressor
VDSLSGVGRLARAQEGTIARYFDGVADLEETLARTSVLLASLTEYTAMVVPPALDRSRFRHVELVALGPRVVLLILILDSGRIEKRMIELPVDADPFDLEALRRQLNEALEGERLTRAGQRLGLLAERVPPDWRPVVDPIVDAIELVVGDRTSDRVFLGGQAHLARPKAFPGLETVHALYEVLEQQMVLVRLLAAAIGSEELSVTIGSENAIQAMQACSLVTARYPAGGAAGTIGVLGPTRMDYLRAMTAVQAVARYLGDVLDDDEH